MQTAEPLRIKCDNLITTIKQFGDEHVTLVTAAASNQNFHEFSLIDSNDTIFPCSSRMTQLQFFRTNSS